MIDRSIDEALNAPDDPERDGEAVVELPFRLMLSDEEIERLGAEPELSDEEAARMLGFDAEEDDVDPEC